KDRAYQPPREASRKVIDRNKLKLKSFPGHDIFLQALSGADKEKLRALYEKGFADGDSRVNMAPCPPSCDQDFHPLPLPTDLEMLRRTPTAAKMTTREVLPKLTKGRVMPVTGKEPVATPMLSIA